VPYYTENIIKQINNPTARRIKFKDERKITVGISKKDIMNYKSKQKNAFYNCFAMILRFRYDDAFREIHVKVFNTGKLEIPGILNTRLLDIVKEMILNVLDPHTEIKLDFLENSTEDNVLINSNFNCGFYINREKLHSILRSEKYRIESAYDPCSYPGVKCKFYFNNEIGFDTTKQQGQILTEDRNMKMSELGINKSKDEVLYSSSPVQTTLGGNDWKSITSGGSTNTKYAIKNDGTLWAWGGSCVNIGIDSLNFEVREPIQNIKDSVGWKMVHSDEVGGTLAIRDAIS
jgi:hypothetical protein